MDTQTADSQGVLLQGEVFRPARHAHLASGAHGRRAGAPSGQLPGVPPLQKDVLTHCPFQVLEAPFSQPLTQGGSPTLPPSSPTKRKCPLPTHSLGTFDEDLCLPKGQLLRGHAQLPQDLLDPLPAKSGEESCPGASPGTGLSQFSCPPSKRGEELRAQQTPEPLKSHHSIPVPQ